MKMKLVISSPPFSINRAYYKKSKTRTQECRKWGEKILQQLQKYKKDIDKINKYVTKNINTKCLHVETIFYINKQKFFTKTGKVSRNSMDLTNVEKLLIDIIFDKRHADRGGTNFSLDDCLIVYQPSSKKPCEGDSFIVLNIEVKNNEKSPYPQFSDFYEEPDQ